MSLGQRQSSESPDIVAGVVHTNGCWLQVPLFPVKCAKRMTNLSGGERLYSSSILRIAVVRKEGGRITWVLKASSSSQGQQDEIRVTF